MDVAQSYLDNLRKFINEYDLPNEIAEGRFPTVLETINSLLEKASEEIDAYLSLLGFFFVIIMFSAIIKQLNEKLIIFVNITAGTIIALYVMKSTVFNPGVLLADLEIPADFVKLFIPIFAAVTALSGNITLSTLYGTASMLCIELFSKINIEFALPIVNATISVGILSAIAGGERFESVFKALRMIVTGSQIALSTLILGVMSLNGFAAKGTDTLIFKAGKLVSGAVIPVIGSTISSSYETVAACFTSAASIIGSAGMFIIVAISAKSILRAAAFVLVSYLSEIISEFLCCCELKRVFTALKSSGLLILGAYIFELMVLVFGIALIMLIGG